MSRTARIGDSGLRSRFGSFARYRFHPNQTRELVQRIRRSPPILPRSPGLTDSAVAILGNADGLRPFRYERLDRDLPAEARNASQGWWSQAGSNRRPHHCERCALPAELWPRTRRLVRRLAIWAI